MAHYIDADRLKAEIERRRLSNRYIDTEGYESELIDIIDSLQQEQPEVDLEKEYQEFCKDCPFPWSSQYVNREYIDELCLSVARHFYDLGRKAKREESR